MQVAELANIITAWHSPIATDRDCQQCGREPACLPQPGAPVGLRSRANALPRCPQLHAAFVGLLVCRMFCICEFAYALAPRISSVDVVVNPGRQYCAGCPYSPGTCVVADNSASSSLLQLEESNFSSPSPRVSSQYVSGQRVPALHGCTR